LSFALQHGVVCQRFVSPTGRTATLCEPDDSSSAVDLMLMNDLEVLPAKNAGCAAPLPTFGLDRARGHSSG
jgi:hypothetical protein